MKTLSIIHADENAFPFTSCDKIFAFHATFKKHELIYSGEKSYTCSVCEKKFRT